MTQSWRNAICTGCICLSLTGCSIFLEDTYVSITPHTVAPIAEGSEIVQVESYHELVNAILYYVTLRSETAQVRLGGYSKEEAKTDLTEAVAEILQDTALGSFGVEGIQWEINSIMGTLEGEITLSYKKTAEEFDQILHLNGSTAITRTISLALSEMSPSLLIQNSWASNDRSQISQLLQEAYSSSARTLVEIPNIHTTFYPTEGPWRIMEMQFQYKLSQEEGLLRQSELAETLSTHTSPLWSEGEEDLYQTLLQILTTKTQLQTTGNTPYHVLVMHKGNSQGFALSYLALCQEMALQSSVVQGTLLGETHYWNIITLPTGQSHHVDSTQEPDDEGKFPYYSDDDIEALGYQWKRINYPICSTYLPEKEQSLY